MTLALTIVACILFLIAAIGFNTGRVSIGWLGMFFWVLSTIWGKF